MWYQTQIFQLFSILAMLRFFMLFRTKGVVQRRELAVSKLD